MEHQAQDEEFKARLLESNDDFSDVGRTARAVETPDRKDRVQTSCHRG